jgi:hypothetical protein
MTTFKIKLVSQTNAIIVVIVLLTLFFSGAILFQNILNKIPDIIFFTVILAVSYFGWQIFATGRTEWTVTNKEVTIIWTKTFALTYNENLTIQWNDIENISRGLDPQYYNLKIKLTSGKTIKFYHDTLTTRDDFEELLKTLYQSLNDKKLQPT